MVLSVTIGYKPPHYKHNYDSAHVKHILVNKSLVEKVQRWLPGAGEEERGVIFLWDSFCSARRESLGDWL